MKISLCMIVKNEESQIIPCLERALDFVDEAIIVDTGSTDQTKVLIHDTYGDDARVKVYDYVWENDFGKARSESLKYATGDWVLVLDADERLFADRIKMESFVKDKQDKAFIVMIYNIIDANTMFLSPTMVRFYQREGASYSGAIHEQLCYNGVSSDAPVMDEDACRIYHYGYSSSIFLEKGKQNRNMEIIKEEIEKAPESAFNWYNLGVMEMTQGDYQAAIDAFLKSHKLCKGIRHVFHADLILRVGQCMIISKQYKQLISYVNTLSNDEVMGKKPDLFYYQGIAYGELKKYENAYQSLNKAISLGEDTKGISRYGVGSFIPKLKWAELLTKQKRYDNAVERYWDAIFDKHNVQQVGLDLFREFLIKHGRTDDLEALERKLAIGTESDQQKVDDELLQYMKKIKVNVSTLIESGDFINAHRVIMDYEQLMPDDIELYSLKGVLAYVMENSEKAEKLFLEGLVKEPENYDLLFNLGVLYRNLEREEDALTYFKKARAVAPSEEDEKLLAEMIEK